MDAPCVPSSNTLISRGENLSEASLPIGRGAGLSTGESEVIAIFEQMTQALGIPRSLGRIYGLLFATPRPLVFQDIVDRLEMSKGSVSQGLRFLRTVGAINPVEVEGDRREFFEPVVELRQLVSGLLRERLNPQIEEWGARVKRLQATSFGMGGAPVSMGAAQKAELGILEGRIDKLKTWQKRAGAVLPMVGKLLG